MKIGIIYIATGDYARFWKDFYPTCECFFCTDVPKGYEVFTDSSWLLSMNLPDVCFHPIEDEGFIKNVSSKSRYICGLSSVLEQKYDYIFYMNGNYKFVEPIVSEEVLPGAGNDFLTVLSFDVYKNKSSEELPYDRNPCCGAYIPFGQGERYYQGGFYGGRTREVLKLSGWCASRIKEDLGKKVIARFHDESYLNRYLLNFHPRILNEIYGKACSVNESQGYKAILLHKDEYLGRKQLYKLKGAEMDHSLSFLLNDHLQINSVGVVTFQGRLGNQMFQYAFYLYLQSLKSQRRLYLSGEGGERVAEVFDIPPSHFLPDDLHTGISTADCAQIDSIFERQISRMQACEDSSLPIAYYTGYWQCWGYVEANAEKIRQHFTFQESKLNEPSALLLQHIRDTCSVSIHVRRGDYCSPQNQMIYGGICSMRYYMDAMRRMKRLLDERPTCFVFTDDPEWVNTHLCIDNCVVVDCNQGCGDDWQDMALMSACRHHIIANSSFSWWGAWLGDFPGKQVIAPQWWYNGVVTPDLLPDTWIRIPVRESDFQITIATSLLLKAYSNTHLGLWRGKMALVLFFFRYSRQYRNKFCREYAEAQLEYVCQNLRHLSSVSHSAELSGICRDIVYLMENGFVKANPNTLFIEVDHYLAGAVRQKSIRDLSFSNGLCGVVSYIVARIAFLSTMKRPSLSAKNRLESIIHDFLDDMTERANSNIPTQEELHDLLILLQRISKLPVFERKTAYLYAFYCSHTDDNNYLLYPLME